IKKRLKQIYGTEFDLLIVDETHYGAWAHEYGKPIKDADEDVIEEEQREYGQFKNKVEKIAAVQQLHLSGTPYNLLYENKFTQENIVAMCQYKDILTEKEKWDEEHFEDIENDVTNPETGFPYQESDNPYFGFPKMLRFAFNLPDSIREELRRSKTNGAQWTLNDLFATVKKDGEIKFKHEAAVLSLLKAIDGSEESDEIFGFLNVPKIRDNDVCKHMVFALPFKYACDAMELLLQKNKEQFLNLDNYKVLNITGHNLKKELDSVDKVKAHISQCENSTPKIKTITLTVYKMLTGVTVKEWDTMIMLKNTQSPQEYDQAIFRIQNQFVQEYAAENGSKFKKDLKPQTILVDFDPVRMFNIQGLSTRVVNKVKGNNQSLEKTVSDDLSFSPIIAYNAKKLVKVEPKNLIELILKYNREKSIIDDVKSVTWNAALLSNSDLAAYIRSQNANGLDNSSTKTEANDSGEQSELEDTDGGNDGSPDNNTQSGGSGNTDNDSNSGADKDLAKKYRMCIAKIAFYAFLSKSDIDSLKAVLDSLDSASPYSIENNRIFENLELNKKFIQGLIKFISRIDALGVDEVIKRANMLSKDEQLSENERAANALNRFNRFSTSEIVTPNKIAENMCNLIGKDKLVEIVNNGEKILDIASKAGEFSFALYSVLKGSVEDEKLRNSIYSIPTSTTAYEFTRRIYEALGLNVECIAYGGKKADEVITSYVLPDCEKIISLLTQDKPFYSIKRTDTITQGGKQVKFGAVVGNPPYQVTVKEATEGNNKNAVDIYQDFQKIALSMADISCLIYPAKEFQRGKLNTLDQRLEYLRIYNGSSRQGEKHIPDEESVFGDIVRRIPGDVGVFLYNNDGVAEKVIYQDESIERTDKILPVRKEFLSIAKKLASCADTFKWSGIKKVCESNFVQYHKNSVLKEVTDRALPTPKGYTKVLTNDKAGSGGTSKWYYIKTDDLDREPVDKYKIVITSAYPNEAFVNDKYIELLECDEAFGRSKLAIYDTDDKSKAENCKKYLATKFAKCINLMTPYKFLYYLPDFDTIYKDIDWNKSVEEIDKQLYKKYGFTDDEISLIDLTV
ncbi:MAG: Eco57I restriction-modification methylase domain-containing protein, partial [Clostridia bacterium]|nr:Eco57I restriction-modification methylase domain-containing protein [Clostridia bacterium]